VKPRNLSRNHTSDYSIGTTTRLKSEELARNSNKSMATIPFGADDKAQRTEGAHGIEAGLLCILAGAKVVANVQTVGAGHQKHNQVKPVPECHIPNARITGHDIQTVPAREELSGALANQTHEQFVEEKPEERDIDGRQHRLAVGGRDLVRQRQNQDAAQDDKRLRVHKQTATTSQHVNR